jgi:hypothetical protein
MSVHDESAIVLSECSTERISEHGRSQRVPQRRTYDGCTERISEHRGAYEVANRSSEHGGSECRAHDSFAFKVAVCRAYNRGS